MKEILTSGDVTKDFERLGVNPKITYGDEDTKYCVYEFMEDDFETLCNEEDIEDTWVDCGWRYCEGSNMGEPNMKVILNRKSIWLWVDLNKSIRDFNFSNLLEYISEEVGVTTFKNVCAVTTDLAKYNNIKLSELFNIYQG